MAYVAVVVQSRLSSMDASLEEAAQDLGDEQLRLRGHRPEVPA